MLGAGYPRAVAEPTVCIKGLRLPFLTASIRTGTPLPTLAEGLGVSPLLLGDITARAPHSLVVRVWDGLARACGEPAFGVLCASTLGAPQLDVADLVLHRAETFDVLTRSFLRYQRLFHEANDVHTRVEGGDWVMEHRFRVPLARSRPFSEFILAIWVSRLRAIVGPSAVALRCVRYRHEAPADVAPYREHFGADVVWGAEEDAIVLAEEALHGPLVGGDPARRTALELHLERELSSLPSESLLDDLRRHVVALVRSGSERAFDVDHVAQRLALSRRTLQRRLAEQGTSFRDQVDLARREIATSELRRGTTTLTELAFMLGFSENSAFARAFRRWTGTTPGQFVRG